MRVKLLCCLMALLFLTPVLAGDSWVYNKTANAPTPRANFSFAYSEDFKVSLLFGGENASGRNSELWAYNFSDNSWTFFENETTLPAPVSGASLTYDKAIKQFVLFGGLNDSVAGVDDLWIYNISDNSWTWMNPSGDVTMGRYAHSGIFHQSLNRTMFAGGVGQGLPALETTGVYNYSDNVIQNWVTPATTGTKRNLASAYDTDSDKFLLFGGEHAAASQEALLISYNSTDNTIQKLTGIATTPQASFSASMVYDSVNDRSLFFGGRNSTTGFLDDTYAFNWTGNTWTEMNPLTEPSARNEHGAVFDSLNRVMVMFGGNNGSLNNESWVYYFVEPAVDFDHDEVVFIDDSVNFWGDNISFNVQKFYYDFGDNATFSVGVNATHTYTSAGEFNVCIIGESFGSVNYTTCRSTHVSEKPYPWFTWIPTPSHVSDTLTMKDLTFHSPESGNASNWVWDWGDDFNTTNDTGFQNMTHKYSWQPGYFQVTLNLTNYFGVSNATTRGITVSGIRVMTWEELSPNTNVTFNISIANSTNTYSEDVSSGVFIWRNVSQGIPTGSVTLTISKTNFEARQYVRTFDSTHFINLTAFLISSNDCVVQPFIVRNSKGALIQGATITINKTIDGVNREISQRQTDSAGSASICLDANTAHTLVVSAIGYSSLTKTINPTSSTLLITLGGEVAPPTFTANQTFYFFLNPFSNMLNVSHDVILGRFQDPQCTIQWFELNISNETAVANSSIIFHQPCSGGLEAAANATTGLKDLPAGTKVIASLFAYSNRSNNATYNHTYYVSGAQHNVSVASGLELLRSDFSQGGQSLIAIVAAMGAAATFSLMFGFGAGLIAVGVGGVFWIFHYIPTDVFILSAMVAVTSLLSKRWQ